MRSLRAWLHRLTGSLTASRRDRELREELASHLAMHVEDNIRAGMSPEQARRHALARLGGIETVREQYRDRARLSALSHLGQDIRYGARALRRNPAFTAVALVTLGLGIGANTAIFSVVNAVLLRPLPFADSSRLVLVWATDGKRQDTEDVASYPDFEEWRRSARSFADMAAFTARRVGLTGAAQTDLVQAMQVSATFFDVLGARVASGRGFTDADGEPGAERVAILSDGLWRRQYGGRDVLGQTIRANDQPYTIVGVAPPGFAFMLATPEQIYVPLIRENDRTHGYLRIIGRLGPGVSRPAAQAEMTAIAARIAREFPRTNADVGSNVVPLVDAMAGEARGGLFMFLGVVGLVLLVACTNVANLVLARNASRAREFAVRRALGAGRLRLAQQLLTESVLLALAGGAVGLLFAQSGTKGLVALLSRSAPAPRIESAGIDLPVLGFTLAVSLLTGILFGALPAIVASPREREDAWRESGRGQMGAAGRRTRAALVVLETALALVLLVGAGMLLKGLFVIRSTATGFTTSELIVAELQLPSTFSAPAIRGQFFGDVLAAVAGLPDVKAAGLVSSLPFGGGSDSLGFKLPERAGDRTFLKADFNVVSPGYFRAMQVPMLGGREFDTRDRDPVIVVNQSAARKFWPGQEAVGKQILLPSGKNTYRTLTVVGVSGDLRQTLLSTRPRPEIFLNALLPGPDWPGFVLVVRTSADPARVGGAIRTLVHNANAAVPVARIGTMDDVMASAIAQPQVYSWLLAGFASLALLLAAVGLYGVVSYSATQRTQEIGVRMALGATPRDVVRMLVGQGTGYSLAGVALGALGGVAFSRALSAIAPEILGLDLPSFAAVTLLLVGTALAASYFPARRGAAVDPMRALRAE